MKTASLVSVLSVFFFAASTPCGEEWYQRLGRTYEHRVPIPLTNPLPVARTQEPVVLNLRELAAKAGDVTGKSCVVVDPGAASESPCGIESGGNDTPSQIDDLDGDGEPDELVFLATLAPGQKKTYYIYFTEKNVPPFVYPRRTQIVDFQRADANALVAIESDVLAFRFNRDATGIAATDSAGQPVPGSPGFVGDLLGKNRRFLGGYTLHLYDQKLPLWNYGNRPFHEYANLTPVGQSLLDPFDSPEQLGIGSVLARQGGMWRMAQTSQAETQARITVDGRIRSVGEIETSSWQVNDGIYDVQVRCSMVAEHRYVQYDLTVTARKGQGGQFAVGLMRLENERHDIQAEAGRLAVWGDRARINVQGVGLAVLFRPEEVKSIADVPGGRVLELAGRPTAERPLRATLYLSGGCQEQRRPQDPYWAAVCPDQANRVCGEFKNEQEFFDLHAELARKVSAPIGIEPAPAESCTPRLNRGPVGWDSVPTVPDQSPNLRECPQPTRDLLTRRALFLANPSNKPSVLPGELELGLRGFEQAFGVEPNNAIAEVANLDGSAPVFVGKQVGPLRAEKIALRAGAKGAAVGGGFGVEEGGGDEGGLWVASGKAKWLVTGNGLRKVCVGEKELAVQQPGVKGAVKILHRGTLVLIVRVGDDNEYTDYVFFQGTDVIRIAANHPLRFASGQAQSYVGKKELGVAGCERAEFCSWGRWSSDSVFDKVSALYPAEWSALFAGDRKLGLMCYGSPSSPEINVEKDGKLESTLAGLCQRQELYLTPIETIEDAEDLFPVMSRPFVFVPHDAGFVCREDRNGNGVVDTVQVEDRLASRRARWSFRGTRWSCRTTSSWWRSTGTAWPSRDCCGKSE